MAKRTRRTVTARRNGPRRPWGSQAESREVRLRPASGELKNDLPSNDLPHRSCSGRPKRPQGRTVRTAAMMMKTKAIANWFVYWLFSPKEITSPTISAPTAVPTMLPRPPITLMAKASTSTSVSMLAPTAWLGATMAPPRAPRPGPDHEDRGVEPGDVDAGDVQQLRVGYGGADVPAQRGAVEQQVDADRYQEGGSDHEDRVAGVAEAADVERTADYVGRSHGPVAGPEEQADGAGRHQAQSVGPEQLDQV